MQKNNSLWQFFSSVKLALVILCLITVTSIIGTVIPQKESIEFYTNMYGPQMAQIFVILDIPDMYNSWWFLALLFLLGFNLVICSIERFPGVWKQITSDGLAVPAERIEKMSTRLNWTANTALPEVRDKLAEKLRSKGFKPGLKEQGEATLIFAQKGHWTRTGVYIVHASILVIFLGAIIGYLGGFKGSLMVPETMERDRVFLFGGKGVEELDFAVRCNNFRIEFYPNGMPKEYTSSLTVIEDGTEVLTKVIEVNDPLTYKGITFYQSSYEPSQDFVISVASPSGAESTFIVPFQQQESWQDENLTFGIINARALGQSIVSSKLWFSDGEADPASLWVNDGEEISIERPLGTYRISAKQMYATGLQVAKDPGVWWVYIGCGMMLFGLYVAFFMSHRRIWLLLRPQNGITQVVMSGSANKNRPGFERTFEDLGNSLQEKNKQN
jgi:cytochrome c biogenesis protein